MGDIVDSADNGNGKVRVTLAVLDAKMNDLVRRQEEMLKEIHELNRMAWVADGSFRELRKQIENNTADIYDMSKRVEKIKERSDRQDGVVAALSVVGSLIAAFFGVRQ